MATTDNISIPTLLCADPNGGHIFKYLLNGGSWFEADQMHWRLVRDQTFAELRTVLAKKPTVSHVARAKELMATLHEVSKQLICDDATVQNVKKAEPLVTGWSKPKGSVSTKANVFSALVEDSDEE